ncbi:carbon starvation protein A [Escherichia coli]|nr:carbon starvation protein A [Escherichia coli]
MPDADHACADQICRWHWPGMDRNLFPFLFITIGLWCGVWLPCADLFRHHAEDAGERRAGVLYRLRWDVDESFVAIMALVSACIIDPGVYLP